MSFEQNPFDIVVSASLNYLEQLVEIKRLWRQDAVVFGSLSCLEISTELTRRSVELNAIALDWEKRAKRTKAMESEEL